ncbi:MAG: sugar O-acetyltransferase, partial [Lentisphaeria bacterium]|nr:sugar O-acetyltransferase [Lentisphaeria bacterium]
MMTEKEKARAGFLYDANHNAEIDEDHLKAMDLCYEANNLPPRMRDKRHAILRVLFGRAPEKFYIEPPFNCGFGYNIEIGENFYANFNCVILDNAKVKFG